MPTLSNHYLAIVLMVCILALLCYIYDLRRKNRHLTETVRRLHLQERIQLSDLENRQPYEELNKQEELFVRLCRYMDQEKPFLNPELKIEHIVAAMRTNRTYLACAIKNYANGLTVQQFIMRYRLRYAASLIERSEPLAPISEIYAKAGFASRSTFNRQFFLFFKHTPSSYKALVSLQRVGDIPSAREKTLEK